MTNSTRQSSNKNRQPNPPKTDKDVESIFVAGLNAFEKEVYRRGHAAGRAESAEEITRLRKTCLQFQERYAEATSENKRLREALQFYADQNNWDESNAADGIRDSIDDCGWPGMVGGKRARAALNENMNLKSPHKQLETNGKHGEGE